jgi:hypothetical protein
VEKKLLRKICHAGGGVNQIEGRPELLGIWLSRLASCLPPSFFLRILSLVNDFTNQRFLPLHADAGVDLLEASPPMHPSFSHSNFAPSSFSFGFHIPILLGCNHPPRLHKTSSRDAYVRTSSISAGLQSSPHPMTTGSPACR